MAASVTQASNYATLKNDPANSNAPTAFEDLNGPYPQSEHNQNQRVLVAESAIPGTSMPLYFGYGSNLWQEQMAERCPHSGYVGVARLERYRWIIYEKGYANIVETSNTDDVVYGLVYHLTPSDEANLDRYEGVAGEPPAYSKELIPASFWPSKRTHTPITPPPSSDWVDVTNSTAATNRTMLVYINRNLTAIASPKEEYISRMNAGIKDAEICGVPKTYIDHVIREFIPSSRKV